MSDLEKSDSRSSLPLTGLTAYTDVIFHIPSSKRLTPLQFTCRTGRLERADRQVGVREQARKIAKVAYVGPGKVRLPGASALVLSSPSFATRELILSLQLILFLM
jgi:hypothetical protein